MRDDGVKRAVVGESDAHEHLPRQFFAELLQREFARHLQRGGQRVAVLLIQRIEREAFRIIRLDRPQVRHLPVDADGAAVVVRGLRFFIAEISAAVVAQIQIEFVADFPSYGQTMRVDQKISILALRLAMPSFN